MPDCTISLILPYPGTNSKRLQGRILQGCSVCDAGRMKSPELGTKLGSAKYGYYAVLFQREKHDIASSA
jgi:hypothetical protein